MNWDYIAGFFDGEGCLTVANRKRGGIKYQISISQCQKEVLEEIKNFTKVGNVYEANHRGNRNWKPVWKKAFSFRISKRKDILFFIENIKDRIIVKREEILNKKITLENLDRIKLNKHEKIRENLKICKIMRDNKIQWEEIGKKIGKSSECARCFFKDYKKNEEYKDIFGRYPAG